MPQMTPPPLRLTGTTGPVASPSQGVSVALPGLPRRALTAAEQAAALQRVQQQADQRLKLGLQLFKAAEAQTTQQHALLDVVKQEQTQLRQEIREDVARSLRDYDLWVGALEKRLVERLDEHEQKLKDLEESWTRIDNRLQTTMLRAETLLDQTRYLLLTKSPGSQSAIAAAEKPTGETGSSVANADDRAQSALFSQIMERINAQDEDSSSPVEPI